MLESSASFSKYGFRSISMLEGNAARRLSTCTLYDERSEIWLLAKVGFSKALEWLQNAPSLVMIPLPMKGPKKNRRKGATPHDSKSVLKTDCKFFGAMVKILVVPYTFDWKVGPCVEKREARVALRLFLRKEERACSTMSRPKIGSSWGRDGAGPQLWSRIVRRLRA